MPYQPNYDVQPGRMPYTFRPAAPADGRQTGVLVLHGFIGSPLSSRPMAEYLKLPQQAAGRFLQGLAG
jgi:hypothetical protein